MLFTSNYRPPTIRMLQQNSNLIRRGKVFCFSNPVFSAHRILGFLCFYLRRVVPDGVVFCCSPAASSSMFCEFRELLLSTFFRKAWLFSPAVAFIYTLSVILRPLSATGALHPENCPVVKHFFLTILYKLVIV